MADNGVLSVCKQQLGFLMSAKLLAKVPRINLQKHIFLNEGFSGSRKQEITIDRSVSMKRILSLFLVCIMLFSFGTPLVCYGQTDPLKLISEAAVLMDAKTGQILYEKNMRKRMYPASITKIMTGLLAVERGDLTSEVTVKKTSVMTQYDVTHIDLLEDEKLTLDELLHACLLVSANDASSAIAEKIAGTQQNFVGLMNEKARAIGTKGTHFTNVHGLPDDNHYTTAEDMALITKYAVQNLAFMKVFGTTDYTIKATNKTPKPRVLSNAHEMLQKSSLFYYGDVVGGKLGWIQASEHTAVTVAQQGDRQLIAVVMKSPKRDEKYRDTKVLLDYGFNEFHSTVISKSSIDEKVIDVMDGDLKIGTIDCVVKDDFSFLLHDSVAKNLVEMNYRIPVAVSNDNAVEHDISFRLPDSIGAMYQDLGSVPVIHIKKLYAEQVSGMVSKQSLSRFLRIGQGTLTVTMVLFVALFCLRLLLKAATDAYKSYDYKKRKALLKQRILEQEKK